MESLHSEFEVERIKRSIVNCEDLESLKVITLKLLECNVHLKEMLGHYILNGLS